MQKLPMIAFDYTIEESPLASSEILSTPASKRWWRLVGEGTFQTATKTIKQKTWLTAYRDNGDWFFSPPDIDDMSGSQLSPDERLKDRKDDVDLATGPNWPLEVVDVHVFIDPTDAKVRNIKFRLHNRTILPVTRYGYKISDEHKEGSISFGTGAQKDSIEPNGTSHEFHEDYPVSRYLCEGDARIQIQIENVGFADGTEWSAPEPPQGKPSKE